MLPLQRPIRANYLKDKELSYLEFPDKSGGEYYLRGGICWPKYSGLNEGIQGFAILAGLDVSTGIIRIFEERRFSSVDHIQTADGKIEIEGLSSWFNKNWNKYYAAYYFFSQIGETHKKYLLDVVRSDMVQPKPLFVEIKPMEDANIDQIVFSKLQENKLEYFSEGPVHKCIQQWDLVPTKPPVAEALGTCISGITRYPYRKQMTSDEAYFE